CVWRVDRSDVRRRGWEFKWLAVDRESCESSAGAVRLSDGAARIWWSSEDEPKRYRHLRDQGRRKSRARRPRAGKRRECDPRARTPDGTTACDQSLRIGNHVECRRRAWRYAIERRRR